MNGDLASHQAEIDELCRRFGGRSLELFGSAARGDDQPGTSDLAFLVEFQPEPPGGYADVDHRLVWDIVETKLPVLLREIEALLAD